MAHQTHQLSPFGNLLRDWRQKRRFSQLSLALVADVSARHVCFLETGRAQPSREMVLQLADSLAMPKAETNHALQLAGFTPAYLQRPVDDADLAPVHQAISHLLNSHMPYPAIALDDLWNIKAANKMAVMLLESSGFGGHKNLLEALASQTPEQSKIENWEETIGLLIARLRAETLISVPGPKLQTLVDNLISHFNNHAKGKGIDRTKAVISTSFNIDGRIISVFSTIASFGSVQDVVLDNLKVELMFPADEVAEAYFREMANITKSN